MDQIATAEASSVMTITEKIYEKVRTLSDREARSVLDFVAALKTKQQDSGSASTRQEGLDELACYRGRFKMAKFSREELYD